MSLYPESAPKVNGINSGPRPILHQSFAEIRLAKQIHTGEDITWQRKLINRKSFRIKSTTPLLPALTHADSAI